MTFKEYREYLYCDLFRDWGNAKPDFINSIRVRYFQPNTNCVYLARTMWFLYSKGKIGKLLSKLYYLRIIHKYGCCIFPSARIAKGFVIAHPVGIVIGDCDIGENFTIHQNCTIGVRGLHDNVKGLHPYIGNHVEMGSNSIILGGVHIADNVTIGALAFVNSDIRDSGLYVGIPARKKKR